MDELLGGSTLTLLIFVLVLISSALLVALGSLRTGPKSGAKGLSTASPIDRTWHTPQKGQDEGDHTVKLDCYWLDL